MSDAGYQLLVTGVLPFANGIVGLGGSNRLAATDTSLPGKQMRAFREYDQKWGWRQPVPPAKAREPHANEVVKCWTAEITKTTDVFKRLTQRDLSLTGGCDPHV